MKYRVITDPDLPCRRSTVVTAKSTFDACRKGILKTHRKSGCELFLDNIGEIEKNEAGSKNTHVVTVVPTKTNGPANLMDPLLSKMAEFLRIPGVWFWCNCIVKKLN